MDADRWTSDTSAGTSPLHPLSDLTKIVSWCDAKPLTKRGMQCDVEATGSLTEGVGHHNARSACTNFRRGQITSAKVRSSLTDSVFPLEVQVGRVLAKGTIRLLALILSVRFRVSTTPAAGRSIKPGAVVTSSDQRSRASGRQALPRFELGDDRPVVATCIIERRDHRRSNHAPRRPCQDVVDRRREPGWREGRPRSDCCVAGL